MRSSETPKITVAIRKRPLNKKQLGRGQTDIIKIQNRQSIVVSEYKQKVDLTKYMQETTFNFDYAFNENSTNEQIYEASIRPLIDNAFEGAKISCFAYGQTGSGKTFTMKGDMTKGVPGLYFLAAKEIFNYLEYPQFQRLTILVSFYEIYCGKLFDLLDNRKQLKIREDKNANINIIGLEEKPIYSANEFLDIIQYGSTFRITSQNATNADSSRSHAIMQIIIKDGKKPFSKVSFIDLAGNERGADHMDQNKQTKIDGAQINKSLLALKQCIRALDQDKGHVPFRGSKLTMVLKDSFVGFCKTVMIGNVSPNVSSSENTMNTLRYADRVKELKKPAENLTKQELQAKEMMLPRANNKQTVKINIDRQDDAQDIQKKLQMAKRKAGFQYQKMQIQREPPIIDKKGSNRQVSLNKDVVGKKTDQNYRIQQRKSPAYNSREMIKNNQNQQIPNELSSKKNIPLTLATGVVPVASIQKISQQKNPFIRQSGQAPRQSGQNPTQIPYQQLNRQHFDAMMTLQAQFSSFKDNHSRLVKEETIIIRDQMTRLGQMSQVEEFGNQAEIYLQLVERSIQEKMRLMNQMQQEVDRLRKRRRQAEDIGKVLQEQKGQQYAQQIEQPKFGTKINSTTAMEIQYNIPKMQNQSSLNNNVSKFTYHSSIAQNNMSQNQQMQSYQPMSNQVPNYSQSTQPQKYQYSQYHQKNNGSSNFNHANNNFIYSQPHVNDEQLLQDLPGDQNMQRLF